MSDKCPHCGLQEAHRVDCSFIVNLLNRQIALTEIVKQLASIDPVYGPIRQIEPRKNPFDHDELKVYTSRRICGLCQRKSEHQGENIIHTTECPWLPAKSILFLK